MKKHVIDSIIKYAKERDEELLRLRSIENDYKNITRQIPEHQKCAECNMIDLKGWELWYCIECKDPYCKDCMYRCECGEYRCYNCDQKKINECEYCQ